MRIVRRSEYEKEIFELVVKGNDKIGGVFVCSGSYDAFDDSWVCDINYEPVDEYLDIEDLWLIL